MNRKHDELHVFLNEKRIGTLTQDNGTMSFAYVPEYLQSPDAYPLSQNLPLQDEVFMIRTWKTSSPICCPTRESALRWRGYCMFPRKTLSDC